MGFKIEADSELIRIDGFQIVPGEAGAFKSAVSFAGGMREFPGLPPYIDHGSFRVNFFEDGSLSLERLNSSVPALNFSFDTVDELVLAVDTALGISVDKKRLDPSPRSSGSLSVWNTGDIIEGR